MTLASCRALSRVKSQNLLIMKNVRFISLTCTLEWMYEIIANKKNSLDVDKLDYLQRDA